MNSALTLVRSQEAKNNPATSGKVLYVTECSAWGERGYEAVTQAFGSVCPIFWSSGMPKPDFSDWQGDWIISFKSDLILSRTTLERAKKGAINFHPSPPRYRGLGGYWWALQNGDDDFGVTCHYMNERIDHGAIIATESFPISPQETVESLKERAALYSLALLKETLNTIRDEKPLMPCGLEWQPHLYTSQELARAQHARAADALRAVTQENFALARDQDEKRTASKDRHVA